MLPLALAALLWLAIHLGLSGTRLRDRAVATVGEKPFAGLFSLLALASLVLLILAYRGADTTPLWYAPGWLIGVIDALMLSAFVLLAAAAIPVRGKGRSAQGEEPRGIARVTRHPMMSAAALWAALHLLANGDSASLLFFGALLLTVLFGLPSIDAKFARRDPARAGALHAATSILPFAAIAAGRNRLVLAEIGWLPFAVGLVAWAAMLHLHPLLIGVPATPP